MSAAEQAPPVIRIDGRPYEIPQSYTLGDTVIIERVTGLDFAAYIERIERGELSGSVIAGVIAWTLRHAHPQWPYERIERLVSNVDLSELLEQLQEMPERGGDDRRPPADTTPSPTSPIVSTLSLDGHSDGAPQSDSGPLSSGISSP